MSKVWMAVTTDKYELPIAVADTATELSVMTGVAAKNIRNYAWEGRSGKSTGKKFLKILIDEEDDYDE